MLLLREAARPAAVREHRLAPWFAVGTVCFGAFMGQLDASIVTLAFPALQRQFASGLAGVQWVSLSYLLALIALLVPVGRWSDRAGRKLVYLYGFVVFTVASAGCGLAWSLGALIVLRVAQAAGAAMLQANSVALVATSAPPGKRRAALGVQAAAQALGLALGPVAGGLLLASLGWRWIFIVNLPVGVVALVAGWFLLPRTRQRADRAGPDPAGLVLLAVGVSGGLLALSAASGLSMPVAAVAGCVAAAVLAGAGLAWWERRAAAPLIDLRLLAGGGLAAGIGGALCAYLVLFGPLVLFPQLMAAHGVGPLRAGLLLAALPAGFGVAAVAGERVLPGRWANGFRCVIGGLAAASCAAALAVPTSAAVTAALLGLLGIGLGVYIPANNAAIMAAVPAGESAAAGGLVNMARGLGTALGVAAVSIALHAGTRPGPAMLTLAAAALIAAWAGHATPGKLPRVWVLGSLRGVGQAIDFPGEGLEGGDRGGQGAALLGGERGQGQVEDGGVGGLPGEDGLATGLGDRQLHGAPVVFGDGPAQHALGEERVHDGGHRVGPHVEAARELTGAGTRLLGQRRKQLELRHGERVGRIGDPGAAAQRAAEPGDRLGQAVRPLAGLAAGASAHGHILHY